MSLIIFSKNLRYLRNKKKLTGEQCVRAVNRLLQKEFNVSGDKLINRKRLGSYEEGRAYCPAYLLPIFCKVLGQKESIALFNVDLEEKEKIEAAKNSLQRN